MTSESETFLRVRPANGCAVAVGTDMSITHLLRLDKVPEVVAWEAEEGRMICCFEWFEILMAADCEKEGLRIEDA